MSIIFLLIQFGILYFLNLLGVSSEINGYIFLFINMTYMIALFINKYKKISGYLMIGYFARVIFMLWDIYAKSILTFPGSGADTEGYYISAVLISNNIKLLEGNIYGGIYSKILGFIFYFIGENRIVGQYINIILGVFIVILLYECLRMLNIRKENIKIAVIVISLFPNALINSAILLRENFITFFVVLSMYFFIKWYKQGKFKNQLFSIISIMIASSFHSGVIGILIGYIFSYILYNRKTGKYRVSLRSIILLVVFALIALIILNNSETFLGKFTKVEGIDDILSTVNSRRGGSQYLDFLQSDTWWKMLLYSPIKMFYFLCSPLPWDWRGFNDLLTFFIDSILYLWFLYIMIKGFINVNKMEQDRLIILGLGLSILITVFIFGLGVSNAGTAMRHRHKILPLFLIISILIRDNIKEAI